MGSTVNPAPKDLPVTLVMQDKGAEVPQLGSVNIGKQIQEQLQDNDKLPLKWSIVESKEAALLGMKDKKYYGAIIFPETMTQKFLSLQTSNPQKPEAEVIINQGKNYSGAAATSQIIEKMMIGVNQQMQNMIFSQIKAQGKMLTADQAQLLTNPLTVKTTTVNEVGTHTANGNLPAMFTQVLWLMTFISSMILFAALKKNNS
jgi:YhgE/Pip-like protein